MYFLQWELIKLTRKFRLLPSFALKIANCFYMD